MIFEPLSIAQFLSTCIQYDSNINRLFLFSSKPSSVSCDIMQFELIRTVRTLFDIHSNNCGILTNAVSLIIYQAFSIIFLSVTLLNISDSATVTSGDFCHTSIHCTVAHLSAARMAPPKQLLPWRRCVDYLSSAGFSYADDLRVLPQFILLSVDFLRIH